jgi:arylsulfatase A-like enzyme
MWDRLVLRGVPVLLLLVASLALGVGSWRVLRERRLLAAIGDAPAGAPNVVLLVLDTVRAMSLSLYGYGRETTPSITAWSASAVRFDHAISAAPWTLASHAVLFTGRYPQELSADYFVGLDSKFPTLATVFGAHGWRTGGFVANSNYCGWETGLQRGFGRYEDWPVSLQQVVWSSALGRMLSRDRAFRRRIGTMQKLARQSAGDINVEFLAWVDRQPRDRPFFAFLNYFDAHQPYLPPAPFDTLWGARRSDGYPRRLHPPSKGQPQWKPEDVAVARDDYDRSLAYLDHEIGSLLAELARRGLDQNTVIVLTADHGEEFAEHGLVEHGESLYRQAVEVPLLIAQPGRVPAGLSVAGPVSLRDVPATIADLAGISDAPFPGHSLARWWRDPEAALAASDTLVSELTFAPNQPAWVPLSRGTMRSVVLGGMRYIRAGDGQEELFDFVADPAELHNLAADSAHRATRVAAHDALDHILVTNPSVR